MAETAWAAYDLPLQGRPASESAAAIRRPVRCPTNPILLQNGAWFCSLRWLVIAALAVLGLLALGVGRPLFARHGIRLEPAWPLAVSGVLLVLNVTYLAMARMTSRSPRLRGLALQVLWLQILLDLAVLTVVVHYLGSLDSLRAVHVPVPHRPGVHLPAVRAESAGDALGNGDVS